MNQGKIVEYIDHGKFVCAMCLQDRGNRLHLLTASNREINLSPKRAILISGTSTDVEIPREELLEKIRKFEETRERLKDDVDPRELWELIHDESESFEHEYLAQLAFGENITDEHISALIRALFEDRLYFKMKDSRLLPNSEDQVEQIARQKEEADTREKLLKEGSDWLKDVLAGKEVREPSCKDEILDLLMQMALYGKDAPDFKSGRELLSRTEISDISKSFDILVAIGVWEEDEDLDILRLKIPTSFSKEQIEASALVAGGHIEHQERTDLRDLATLTIDGLLTRDFDDAISLELSGEELTLGVHIADVASLIKPDSILDQAATERASSLYLPSKYIPMIPPGLSQDALSLKEGFDRLAISLLVRLNREGDVLEYSFAPSIIRVDRNMTYDEVNENFSTDQILIELDLISKRLHQKRIDKGALVLSLPELNISIGKDASVSIESEEQTTPSRTIVAELMILYNSLAAHFCRDNDIPVLFRAQDKPAQLLTRDESQYMYYVFQQRRKLRPLKIDTVPGPHCGLGLELYTQATSPIRRYLDILTQRQIKDFVAGRKPFYDPKSLEETKLLVLPILKDIETVKRNRFRYWILKHLSQNQEKEYKAFILDELKSKYRIVLEEFQLVSEIKRQNGIILRPGQDVTVKVKKVDPRGNLLALQFADS